MGFTGTAQQDYLTRYNMQLIEQHYKDNHNRFIKRMTFRAGTEWDAQDIVQDAYERALRYYKSFDGTNFDKWFSTILNNSLKDFKSKEKGFATSEFDEEFDDGTPCLHYPSRMVVEITDLISTKSVVQMEILTLWMKDEYSAKDISMVTPHSHSNCKLVIKRFKDELRGLYT